MKKLMFRTIFVLVSLLYTSCSSDEVIIPPFNGVIHVIDKVFLQNLN